MFFRIVILVFVFFLTVLNSRGQVRYWQQDVHYTIDVSLNDRDHTLEGFMRLRYQNNSPDTLDYIWFHLWPNAYKNDKTAFSEQLLENGRTDFYFSPREKKGYINRLDFRTNNEVLQVEDHPQHIDIIKLYLNERLVPGDSAIITTPFHVQLPDLFSRSGYRDSSYAVTQWYPKPAVYDRMGWHPMPYLDQGEFYSEFGIFDVRITVPSDYVVAATGERQSNPDTAKTDPHTVTSSSVEPRENKTHRFYQENVHDFAWFADRNFLTKNDTVQLASGRVVSVGVFYNPGVESLWKDALKFTKEAIHFRSQEIGEYPYNSVNVVQGKSEISGGMEYPTITVINGISSSKMLDFIIEHEVGHNWFYGALANNERTDPWMDEGMNTYYDFRYMKNKYGTTNLLLDGIELRRLPASENKFLLRWLATIHRDQPVSTSSDKYSSLNYHVIPYAKAAYWMEDLARILGEDQFENGIKTYFTSWRFRHPSRNDFHAHLEEVTGVDLDHHFAKLDHRSSPERSPKKIAFTFGFNLRDTDKIHNVSLLPILGFNNYDKLMIGGGIHNYTVPPEPFRFFIAPVFGLGSKALNGSANLEYNRHFSGAIRHLRVGIRSDSYSMMQGVDSIGNKIFGRFARFVPSVKVVMKNKSERATIERYVEWKLFLISERGFDYGMNTVDSLFYPSKSSFRSRYINQLTFGINDPRVLYPYDVQVQLQHGKNFYRAGITAEYYFNYPDGGGLRSRFFAARFGYIGNPNASDRFATSSYQPKLTAVRGYEDYTYSNYFLGRNDNDGLGSRQMMMRDGGLKLRTDLFQGLQGRSDDWASSLNFSTSLPRNLLPVKLPIRLFFDIGTYSEAWSQDAVTSRFLYVGGLQVSLFKDLLNVYAPLVYSKVFRDSFKSVPEENGFFRHISFSIDVHRFTWRKIGGNQIPL